MGNNALAIQAENLRVTRGGREVLHGLSLAIPVGTITGLLGPSGSGKTTLMRAVVGVQAHVTGRLTVLGEPAGSPGLRRRIGYATQSAAVYADLTVRDNLRYAAALAGVGRASADEAITTVDLADVATRRVDTLSGGQRGRVSLAVALVARPDLLVLDEPTVGLDPVLRRDLWDTFHELRDAGTTLLVSSHVMDEANQCDDLVLLRDGEVLAETTPSRLLTDTGAPDGEAAFLALVTSAVHAPGGDGGAR